VKTCLAPRSTTASVAVPAPASAGASLSPRTRGAKPRQVGVQKLVCRNLHTLRTQSIAIPKLVLAKAGTALEDATRMFPVLSGGILKPPSVGRIGDGFFPVPRHLHRIVGGPRARESLCILAGRPSRANSDQARHTTDSRLLHRPNQLSILWRILVFGTLRISLYADAASE